MMDVPILIEILEASAKRNGGDKVLTIRHLINILKLYEKIQDENERDERYPLDD